MSENPEEMLSKSINPGGETQRKRHQSMEDLSLQQTTGIELARLLRVCVTDCSTPSLPGNAVDFASRWRTLYIAHRIQCDPISGGRQERL